MSHTNPGTKNAKPLNINEQISVAIGMFFFGLQGFPVEATSSTWIKQSNLTRKPATRA